MNAKIPAPPLKKPARRPPVRKRPELKDIVSGAGQPLDAGLRRDLEARLGHDFGRVRIHTGRDAAVLAELVGAEAVAVGQDVFFAENAFHPETAQGRLLLAHELLHTVQVPAAPGPLRLGRADAVLSRTGDAVEIEAEEVAHGERDGVGRREQQPASLLRYTRVTADQQRAERLDPAAIVDRIAAGVLRSLRGDPADTSGRVRLQLGRLTPELQRNVLDTLEVRLPSPEYQRVLSLLAVDENTEAAPEVAPTDQPASVTEPAPEHEPVPEPEEGAEKPEKPEKSKKDGEKDGEREKPKAEEEKKPDDEKGEDKENGKEEEKKDGEKEQPKDTGPEGPPPAATSAGGGAPAGGSAGSLGAATEGGAPEVADTAVDDAVQGPESPLVKHGVLERPGQSPKEEPEPGEEPIGLEAAPTEEAPEQPEGPEQPVPQEEQPPSDGLPKSDLDVSNVPTADQFKLPADGSPPPQPAPPTFPTPPEPEQKPAEEAKEHTAEFRVAQEQEHRESPAIELSPGQIDADAVEREPAAPVPERIPAQRAAPAAEQVTASEPEQGAGPEQAAVPLEGAGPEQAGPEAGPPGAAPLEGAAPGAPPEDASLEAGGGGCAGAPAQAPPEQSGAGCGGGGGAAPAAAEPAQPAAPDVSAQEPRAALAAVGTQQPADMQESLGQVDASVTTSVGGNRGELQAEPPTADRPSGAPRTLSGKPPEAPPVAADVARVAEVKPEGDGKQPQPADKDVDQGQAATANAAAPNVAGDAQGKLSPEETAHLENAVDDIPTNDPALNTTVGPAPQFALTGETDPALTDRQVKNLGETTGQVTTAGRRDAGQPLGEDHVYPDVPHQTLTGKVPGGGGGAPGGAPAGPGGEAAGGADKAAVSAVAQQERGPQIQAAFGQGAGTMATEQKSHDDQKTEEHRQNQAAIDDAISESSRQQAAQRTDVAGQAKAQREQWRTEQDKAVTGSNSQAAEEHGTTTKGITDQHTETNKGIQGRKDTDNKDIDAKRAKAEADAKKEKDDKKNDSGGIFSWIASKVKAAFDAIVSAITGIFDAARKLIQGVIDGFKKFVNAAIDFARKAVVGLISALATVLIALGDKLLAAFPALRDEFRKAIENLRDDAIAKVNQFADSLKKAVNKFLDDLGKALSKLLDFLEKGLLAAVKFVRDAVNSAIAFVRRAIAVLGAFASIIKDIAANPGGWLRNLAVAIRDGVRNFLFDALVSAVKKWFNDKVEQVLGVGKLIFNVLIKGCLKMSQIVSMVWQAVIKALPMMIIQLVLEKVVAALIPGAGAVLAIIQTIMAAWGTISKILDALSKLVSFLKAIKTGGVAAACLFAQTVAAGAVALLDFITNFLISKLVSAAKGVATKLKGIADKIMKALARGARKVRQTAGKAFNSAKKAARAGLSALKRGASRVAGLARRGGSRVLGAARRGWTKVKGGIRALGRRLAKTKVGKALLKVGQKIKAGYRKVKQKIADWRNKRKPPKKPLSPEERLAKAVARIQSKVASLLRRGASELILRAALAAMRVWYRLTSLTARAGREFEITATLNPEALVGGGFRLTGEDIRKLVHEISQHILDRSDVKQGAMRMRLTKARSGAQPIEAAVPREVPAAVRYLRERRVPQDVPAPGGGTLNVAAHTPPPWQDEHYIVGRQRSVVKEMNSPGDTNAFTRGVRAYPEIMTSLRATGLNDQRIASIVRAYNQTGHLPKILAPAQQALIQNVHWLMFVRESVRNPANLGFAAMTMDLVQRGPQRGGISLHQAFAEHEGTAVTGGRGQFPMSMEKAARATRGLEAEDSGRAPGTTAQGGTQAERDELRRREVEMGERWALAVTNGQGLVGATEDAAVEMGRKLISGYLLAFYGLH